jgi:hypothetical protein
MISTGDGSSVWGSDSWWRLWLYGDAVFTDEDVEQTWRFIVNKAPLWKLLSILKGLVFGFADGTTPGITPCVKRPQKLSVNGPRMVPALAPQPLPMLMDRWFEELETLSRVREQIALLAAQERNGAQ